MNFMEFYIYSPLSFVPKITISSMDSKLTHIHGKSKDTRKQQEKQELLKYNICLRYNFYFVPTIIIVVVVCFWIIE